MKNFMSPFIYWSLITFRLQFINIVVNLLDALKTSFSHRSMAARSLGKKDSISDAAIAGITMFKVWEPWSITGQQRLPRSGCSREHGSGN